MEAVDEQKPAALRNTEIWGDQLWRLDAQRFHHGQRPALVSPSSVAKLALDGTRPLHLLATKSNATGPL